MLPRLRPGVLVQFHDIFYPCSYPVDWIREGRAWNESLFLRAFLIGNPQFEIMAFNSFAGPCFPEPIAMSGIVTTSTRRAAGSPVLIGADGARTMLEKLDPGAGEHNEACLQQLAFDHPEVIPVADIEPAFGELVAVAREVPCGHGYIDNLYVTGRGVPRNLIEAAAWHLVASGQGLGDAWLDGQLKDMPAADRTRAEQLAAERAGAPASG